MINGSYLVEKVLVKKNSRRCLAIMFFKNDAQRIGLSLILEDRQIKKTLSTYLYSPSDFDGKMRTSYFICLETGRSSTQQQNPPIRPSVEFIGYEEGKKVTKSTARGMAFQTITKHGDIGADIRRILIPDDGHVFIQVDSSQAEARIVTHLADDKDRLELYNTYSRHTRYFRSFYFSEVMNPTTTREDYWLREA